MLYILPLERDSNLERRQLFIRAQMKRTDGAEMLIHLLSHSRERLKYLCEPRCGLFAVLSQEFPVRINLESRLFAVRCDEDLVVPSAIGIVFP